MKEESIPIRIEYVKLNPDWSGKWSDVKVSLNSPSGKKLWVKELQNLRVKGDEAYADDLKFDAYIFSPKDKDTEIASFSLFRDDEEICEFGVSMKVNLGDIRIEWTKPFAKLQKIKQANE